MMRIVFFASVKWKKEYSQSDLLIESKGSELSVLAIGAGVREFMSKKTTYTNEPLGKLKIVPDFLPSPEELSLKDETVKITISLSRSSVEFFKGEARKNKTQYQKMIRRLLDAYTDAHRKPMAGESSGGTKARH